jgi:electron transport complex protein RnfG
MKDTITMIAAIVIFATVACVGLAFVYNGTEEQIAKNATAKFNEALKEIFPDADENPPEIDGQLEAAAGVTFGKAYKVTKNGELIGIAINATGAGFNDKITALIGVNVLGKVSGVQILLQTETPGLGANSVKKTYFVDKPANTKTFYGQFTGMGVDSDIRVSKDGGEVVAITASTITSRAVSLIVAESTKAGSVWLTDNGVAPPAYDSTDGVLENGGAN